MSERKKFLKDFELNFLFPHVFLPRKLPQDGKNILKNEKAALKLLTWTLLKILKNNELPDHSLKIPEIYETFLNWTRIQGSEFVDGSLLANKISRLQQGHYMPLYLWCQNSCLILQILKPEHENRAIISNFQVSATNSEVMNTQSELSAVYPNGSFYVKDLEIINSSVFAQQLAELCNISNEETVAKTKKARVIIEENRNVQSCSLVSDWLSAMLCANATAAQEVRTIIKKIRDDILLKNATVPFRRSGMWMCAKAALQLLFTNLYQEATGKIIYKIVILKAHLKVAKIMINDTCDNKLQIIQKIAKRVYKINYFYNNENKVGVNLITRQADVVIEKLKKTMNHELSKIEKSSRSLSAKLELKNINYKDKNIQLDFFLKSLEKLSRLHEESLKSSQCTSRTIIRNHLNCSFPDLNKLDSPEINKLSVHLYDIECWVRHSLIWQLSCNHDNLAKKLMNLLEKYLKVASVYYKDDPVSNSRMILTALNIVISLDKIACDEFPMLLEHHSGLSIEIIQHLLLQRSSDLNYAFTVCDYIVTRNNKANYPSLIDYEKLFDKNTFAQRYFAENISLQELKREIIRNAETKKQMKYLELQMLRQEYKELMDLFENILECEYSDGYYGPEHDDRCKRCYKRRCAKRLSAKVYEWPLPDNEIKSNLVIFELQIPEKIAILRDCLHIIITKIYGYEEVGENIIDYWINYHELSNYANYFQEKISIGSTSDLFTRTHYSCLTIMDNPHNKDFFPPNGLNTYLSSYYKTLSYRATSFAKDLCSFSSKKPFQILNWTVPKTTHSENKVLADQGKCPAELITNEYVKYGSFRVGHNLQLFNLLESLETRELLLKHEAVFNLLAQSLWEVGPFTKAEGIILLFENPESHYLWTQEKYLNALEASLSDVSSLVSNNWNDHIIILNILTIASRAASFSKILEYKKKFIALMKKCRKISKEWEKSIEKNIEKISGENAEEITRLKSKLLEIACFSVLSYYIDKELVAELFNTRADVVDWFSSLSKIYDLSVLYTSNQLSSLKKHLLRQVNIICVEVEPQIVNIVNMDNGRCLSEFVKIRWSDSIYGNFYAWTKVDQEYCFRANFVIKKTGATKLIKIYLDGAFFVEDQPMGKLPPKICQHPLFIDFFESTDFDVQPSSISNQILTSKPIHSENKEISYSFFLNKNDLIIIERRKYNSKIDEFQLIPRTLLESTLPSLLVSDYSHWLHVNENKILFRPKRYSEPSYLDSITYSLDLKKHRLLEILTGRKLVDIKTKTFSEIYRKIGRRLELEKFIHVFSHKKQISVDLPRMGISLEIKNDIALYRSFKVSKNQQISTLFGLEKGIVLIDSASESSENIKKKILIPHGLIKICTGPTHQVVEIDYNTPRKPEFFIYDLDTRLQILRAGESMPAWVYLAWLHGATSTVMPDPFLGITGTAMALQLLQSPHCWSCKPLTPESIVTLNGISQLSPVRAFYNENVTPDIQTIDWPEGLPSMAAHECYLYLAQKIIDDSNRLIMAFDEKNPSIINRICSENLNLLTTKAYYRNYNSTYKLSKEFESIIGSKPETKQVFSSSFNWNTEEINNTRKVASKSFNPSSKFNIKKIITERGDLKADSLSEINLKTVSELLNFWDKFYDHWIGLYNKARNSNSHEEILTFQIMLCFFAYKGIPLDELLLLQKVLYNQNAFKDISDPGFIEYNQMYAFEYNPVIITEILTERYIEIEEYDQRYGQIQPKESDKKYKLRIGKEYKKAKEHNSFKIEKKISSQWPCKSIKDIDFTDYENETNLRIEVVLDRWYKNFFLHKFLDQLHKAFASLELKPDSPAIKNIENISIKKHDFPRLAYRFVIKIETQDQYINELLSESAELYKSGNIFTENYKENEEKQSEKTIPDFPFDNISNECIVKKAYFNDLKKSWNAYHSSSAKTQFFNSEKLIPLLNQSLENYRKKITEYQNFIEKVFFPKNHTENCLYLAGIWPTLTPKKIFQYMLEKPKGFLTIDPKIIDLLGALTVLWTLEQRILRCISYAEVGNSQSSALQRELENKPYENWSPRSKPEWLILEVELDMMIRRIQVEVAEKMMNPPNSKNTVMQLNMGEGKTALIIPMLAASLSNSDNLVRITVLKSLLNINYDALVQKLGGFLNRRVYIFPCRRDKKFDENNMILIQNLLNECKKLKGIVLTLPEYRLSFSLKGLEMCNSSKESKLAEELIKTEQWLKKHTRDILDESDEILNVKYQLVYTIGKQSQIACGPLRWQVSQAVLEIAKTHFKDLKAQFGDDSVFYVTNPFFVMAYPKFRFLNNDAYEVFCRKICFDILKGRSSEINFLELRSNDVETVIEFIIKQEPNPSIRQKIDSIIPVNTQARDIILILRGLFAYQILNIVFLKRWRVDYGVNLINNHMLQAVPFRAKDIPAERAQYAHPDIAILLTQLSYYYSGLTNSQLDDVFKRLENESDGPREYEKWIRSLPPECCPDLSIREYSGLNFSDTHLKYTLVYPLLKMHPLTINYWLNHFLYPKEAKEFTGKLGMSAWDLCGENNHPMTGFSGTNDSKILLPLTARYYEIPELTGTNGNLIANLLLRENNRYKSLLPESSAKGILDLISSTDKSIKLLLDVGALMLELSNDQVIKEWLKLRPEIEAGVFFNEKNDLMVLNRKGKIISFEMSPYRRNLEQCVIYLDDAHTRGTDLKIPKNTIGAVTLGKGVTKDRLMQACMRMRLLGDGHSVYFFSSYEVHNSIKKLASNEQIGSLDVLTWAMNNTRDQTIDGFLYWGSQGMYYYRRQAVAEKFVREGNSKLYSILSSDKEKVEISKLYFGDRTQALITTIIETRTRQYTKYLTNFKACNDKFKKNCKKILKKCSDFISNEKRYAQLLEEEQEVELEIEQEEEVEIVRPAILEHVNNELDKYVEKFVMTGRLTNYNQNFLPLPVGLKNSSIFENIQQEAWGKNIYVTKDFIKTVKSIHSGDDYLKSPKWLVVSIYEKSMDVVILSSFEANLLFSYTKPENDPKTAFFMYLPRIRPKQLQLFSCNNFSLPQTIIQQISVFGGSQYFETKEEIDAYLKFLGFCPQPRTEFQQTCFENNKIHPNGFVPLEFRELVFEGQENLSKFVEDPCRIVCKIVEIRNYGIVSKFGHHLEILLSGRRPIID